MLEFSYDRAAVLRYAERWALARNPAYYDFDPLGGDCTSFVSQCLFAGAGVMNFSPENGWYYVNLSDRSPSWSGVEPLYRFLTSNRGPGPFGSPVAAESLLPGDIIQLGAPDGSFYHSLLVLEVSPPRIFVAAHTNNALWRPLDSYDFARLRGIHIDGVREQEKDRFESGLFLVYA